MDQSVNPQDQREAGNQPNPGSTQHGGYDGWGGYGPSMSADQHRHRMQMMQFDERINALEDCIYQLRNMTRTQGRNMQSDRNSELGRHTINPHDAGSRSLGYEHGRAEGRYDGYRDGRQEARQEGDRGGRQSNNYQRENPRDTGGRDLSRQHYQPYPMEIYGNYPPPSDNMQHGRGYGHRGMWGYGYPDPYALALIASMQYGEPIAIN